MTVAAKESLGILFFRSGAGERFGGIAAAEEQPLERRNKYDRIKEERGTLIGFTSATGALLRAFRFFFTFKNDTFA